MLSPAVQNGCGHDLALAEIRPREAGRDIEAGRNPAGAECSASRPGRPLARSPGISDETTELSYLDGGRV